MEDNDGGAGPGDTGQFETPDEGIGYKGYQESAEAVELYEMEFPLHLPTVIEVDHIPKIKEIQQIWRGGIKEVEQAFSDTVNRVTD